MTCEKITQADGDLTFEQALHFINSDRWWQGLLYNGVIYADCVNCHTVIIHTTEGLTAEKLIEVLNSVGSFVPERAWENDL